jgi:putative transposase
LSESTVGRILKLLKKQGLITVSLSAPRGRKKRVFAGKHATPWSFKDYDSMEIGERVQVDHMSVEKKGLSFKHFQAWDRRSKHINAQVYPDAKSSTARRFLNDLLRIIPFKISSIQVDGGSEFMKEFELACQELDIELIVLPPKRPTYNGGVERGNRIFREEFYAQLGLRADNLFTIRNKLAKSLHKYNNFRPHFGLQGLTPMEYIKRGSLGGHF